MTPKWYVAQVVALVVLVALAALLFGQSRPVESQESGSMLSLLQTIERQQGRDPDLLVHVTMKWGDREISAQRLGQYSADYACFVGQTQLETCVPVENIGVISFNGLLHR